MEQKLTQAQKRALYMERAKQSSQAAASRVQREQQQRVTAARVRDARSYGNAVRDISRDASRRGVISNKPLTARTPVQVRAANTSSLDYREQQGANVVIRHVLPGTRF